MAKLGIDFGTTNSLAVAYDKNTHNFHYFMWNGNDKPCPVSSTVWYHDDTIEVGAVARENINKYADVDGHHFEKSIKSFLGTDTNRYIFGRAVKPYEIATLIIKELKQTAITTGLALKTHTDMTKAVFTIPINFSGKARADLRKSANEAGIEVSTFVHEPFAAIVGYYFTSISSSYEDVIKKLYSLNGKYMLTFDWGGGTLDITVVKIENGKMKEFGTAELTNLAGDAFDKKIADFVWNRFCDKLETKYSLDYLETCKKRIWDKMLAQSEKCKIALSTLEEYEFVQFYAVDDEDIDEIITRKDFSELISDTIDLAISKVTDALTIAGISDNEISHVLLTGGTCYIPEVQSRMKERFSHRVELVKDADLVIAQGAAVISELGWLPFLTKDIQIELCDGSYWAMFDSGTPIAAGETGEKSETFTCVDQRNNIAKIIVCEGLGSEKDKNLAILKVPVLAHHQFGDDIEVKAALDRDIVLTVKAHSKMVIDPNKNYSIQKTAQIHQLCFGLDFEV